MKPEATPRLALLPLALSTPCGRAGGRRIRRGGRCASPTWAAYTWLVLTSCAATRREAVGALGSLAHEPWGSLLWPACDSVVIFSRDPLPVRSDQPNWALAGVGTYTDSADSADSAENPPRPTAGDFVTKQGNFTVHAEACTAIADRGNFSVGFPRLAAPAPKSRNRRSSVKPSLIRAVGEPAGQNHGCLSCI